MGQRFGVRGGVVAVETLGSSIIPSGPWFVSALETWGALYCKLY